MKSKAFIKFLESSTPLIPFLIICHTNSTKFEGVLQLTLTSIGQFLLTKINFSNLFYYNQYLFNLVNMLTLFQFQFENQQSLIFVEPIVNSWDHGFMFPPPFQRALDFFASIWYFGNINKYWLTSSFIGSWCSSPSQKYPNYNLFFSLGKEISPFDNRCEWW